MNATNQSGTLSIRQLQQKLGPISRGALYEAIKRGDIPCIRIGGRILVPQKWLDQQLNAK